MNNASHKKLITEIALPCEVADVIDKLRTAGHEAYAVGGFVRDILGGKKPHDWDVTTSANPEEIMKLFSDSFYENKFLTVTVKTGASDPILKEIEVTTFRAEGKYTDKRHPDKVRFAKTLKEDLSRRDFTINAMALSPEPITKKSQSSAIHIIDPFGGQEDLKKKIIRAVGNPEKRFAEDALRMLRAVRLAAELECAIEEKTFAAIKRLANTLEYIAKERIRDEFIKIVATARAKEGIELLHETELLRYSIPELEEGVGVENRPRVFTIWEHNVKALEYGAKQGFPIDVRIAALLHDVAKPRTKGPMKRGEWTFYGHDVVGGKMAAQILARLHFPRETVEKIATLIRWHLFKYDLDVDDEITTDSSIRRLVRRVGPENMKDLVLLRICDRMGMGVPKAIPYRLRHFQFRVEKILREEEAPTPKMLKTKGEDVMRILEIQPGPKIGHVIEVLLQEVIDDPARNMREILEKRIQELGKLSDEKLVSIAKEAEEKVELAENERVSSLKSKYYVK